MSRSSSSLAALPRGEAAATMVHSVPVRPQVDVCEASTARPHERLRPYVLGYSGFRSGSGRALDHLLLPVGFVMLIVDLETGPILTGARSHATVDGPTSWGCGVSVALSPAGVPALLGGVPMRELTGRTVPLADVIGEAHAARLAEQLASAAGWHRRVALLDKLLEPGHERSGGQFTTVAWQRLTNGHRTADIAAALGVERRHLERRFQQQIGLAPGAIRRIARFQRAVGHLSRGASLAETASASGFADQPHLTRETRKLTAVTPGELRAFVQYRPLAAA